MAGDHALPATCRLPQVGCVGRLLEPRTAASLQITATDSASGQTLTYAAAGLPADLSINSGTGLISGTPTTAGTSTVTVTAGDTTGAAGSAACQSVVLVAHRHGRDQNHHPGRQADREGRHDDTGHTV
jgi:hypothetical protein